MTFKKIKLSKTKTTDITQAYFATKKRNSLVSYIAIFIACLIVWVIGYFALWALSGLHLNFALPKFVTRTLPFLSHTDEPQKLNILLTGVGGAGHDGSDLTDTIMLASINRRTQSVTMISLPRDLYVEFTIGKQSWRGRLNELYQRALFKKYTHEQAMGVLIDKVSEITGEPIDKYFNIDFAGFSDFVDALGGIDVDVPESIIDREYPDNNWGYQTFKITRGFQTLDGATTLKYARSRHSTSDFDRSARQQLIIAAIKDKLVSLDAITNPKKLGKLYDSIATHLRTDLTLAELVDIAVFGAKLEASSILSYNINDGCYQGAIFCRAGGFLYTPERDLFGGLAVLLPDTATASKISAYRDIRAFSSLVCNTPEIFIQPRAISIVNASGETGLANTLAIKLRKYGFTVPERDALSSTKDLITTSRIHYLDSAIDPILGIPSDDPVFEALGSFVVAPIVATGALSYTQLVDSKIEIILSPDASTRISR